MEVLEATYCTDRKNNICIKSLLESEQKNGIIYVPKNIPIERIISYQPVNKKGYIRVLWKKTNENKVSLLESCEKIVDQSKFVRKKPIDIHMENIYHYTRICMYFVINEIRYGIDENQSIDVTASVKDELGSDQYYIDCHKLDIFDIVGDPFPGVQKKLFINYQYTSFFETIVYLGTSGLRKDLLIGIDLNDYRLNMIAHIVPKKCKALSITMDYLCKFKEIFNHKKIISIVEGPGLESSMYLENWIQLSEFHCIKKVNSRTLGEAVSIRELIGLVKSKEIDEYTFYFHSKGITKNNGNDPFVAVWTELMYKYCLSNIDTMIYHDTYVGGAIRSMDSFGRPGSPPYHFTGTFFWFSHKLFNTTIVETKLEDNYYTVEMLSGRLCEIDKSHCFYKDHSKPMYNYHIDEHKEGILDNIDLLESSLAKAIIHIIK